MDRLLSTSTAQSPSTSFPLLDGSPWRRWKPSKRDDQGPQVTEILSVDASTATQEQPRRPRPERPAYHPSADRTTVEEIGTVKWYNANKGFGFIAPDRGGKDIFVHASVLERSGIVDLAEAQRVAVDVADGQKGPEAVGLRVV